MRLSRTNMPLASSDSVISQLTYAVFLDNLAPHLRAENPDHKLFCHSQPQNPPQLSKSGNTAPSCAGTVLKILGVALPPLIRRAQPPPTPPATPKAPPQTLSP